MENITGIYTLMASVTSSTYENGKKYEDIIQNMNNAGIKTTSIRKGREADFEDYGNALSTEMKKMIMDSFDCEQDYALQQQLAGLFANRHDIKNGDLIKACKSMGLNISRTSVKTSYISDYKGGNFSNSVRNGSISVFTISDGKGGEIIIADTNGNGAIESEELFMNQILGDINMEISQISPQLIGIGGSYSGGGINGNNETTQQDFNSKVEEYLSSNPNYSVKEAELKASIDLNVSAMTYTGTYKDNKEENKEIEQDDYNSKVEQYLSGNTTLSEAQEKADKYFNSNLFTYTGSKANNNVSQDSFNDKVKEIYKVTSDINSAVDKAEKELKVFNMDFTGNISDKKILIKK